MAKELSRLVMGSLSITSFLVIWEGVVRLRLLPTYALPAPTDVLRALYIHVSSGVLLTATYHSLVHLTLGFAAATLIAIPLGMLSGWFRRVELSIDPIIELFRPIPPIAWIPFALLFFATFLEASVFIIFIGGFFPIFTNTYFGFKNVPKSLVEVAASMGARQHDLLLKVAFGAALPSILTGLRVGLGVAWMCVVAAEMFGAPGLGYMIMEMRYLHDIAAVAAYMLVIGVLGFAFERLIRFAESKLLKWRKGFTLEV
ncbi:MAG: ABC transporter permease [Candidatus Methanomethylicota archaeon]|uniref:ABC transporter permease n=1 Tax=Thermoproteota archaeon TaxID=2056631 RepID=A0A497EM88_9CREN|nr:MAG: ABC transporter permease [Candidatus Verstraetearchaeota archaeon]RLE52696.1 MAG: ABC transporter permease [Candidatus Verstraetearchaeota archaeon]